MVVPGYTCVVLGTQYRGCTRSGWIILLIEVLYSVYLNVSVLIGTECLWYMWWELA